MNEVASAFGIDLAIVTLKGDLGTPLRNLPGARAPRFFGYGTSSGHGGCPATGRGA